MQDKKELALDPMFQRQLHVSHFLLLDQKGAPGARPSFVAGTPVFSDGICPEPSLSEE